LYTNNYGKLIQYDQVNGDIKEMPKESIHQLQRFGNIDFPELKFIIFKNKVMANLSELYSPEHFAETLLAAEMNQEIVRLTKPNGGWGEMASKSENFASNIVSNGLFSFLKGGLFSANQFWVFCVCVYVTANAVVTFILPPVVAEAAKYLSLGGSLIDGFNKIKKHRANKASLREIEAAANALEPVPRQ
jgi:hypothetical protein